MPIVTYKLELSIVGFEEFRELVECMGEHASELPDAVIEKLEIALEASSKGKHSEYGAAVTCADVLESIRNRKG